MRNVKWSFYAVREKDGSSNAIFFCRKSHKYNLISSLRSRDFNVDDRPSERRSMRLLFYNSITFCVVTSHKKVHEGQLVDSVTSPSTSTSDVVNLGKSTLHFIAHDDDDGGRQVVCGIFWYDNFITTCCQ